MFQYVVLWTLVGYPFLAALTTAFGGNNTLLSITFRGLAVVAAISLIGFRSHRGWFLLLFLGFWLTYFFRLFVTLHIFAEPVTLSVEAYWIWSLGTCFLPSLAVFIGFHQIGNQRLLLPLMVVSTLSMIIVLFAGGADSIGVNGQVLVGSRWSAESLNPISMGHLGVTSVLLAISVLVAQSRRPAKLIALIAVCIGAVLIVLANSRGPLVALAASLIFFFFARPHRRSTLVLGVIFLGIAGYIVFENPDVLFGTNGLISRFTAISSGDDLSASIRQTSFRGAFNQFLESPIFGDGIEERVTMFYPHNVILEAFMSTGLVGGVPFVLITAAALRASWLLLRRGSQDIWIGLLTVQYIFGAQVSGAIYQSSSMWVLIGLAIAATQFVPRPAKQVYSRRDGKIHFNNSSAHVHS